MARRFPVGVANIRTCGSDEDCMVEVLDETTPIDDIACLAVRDGDRAGLFVPGNPQVGDIYRQEISLGNAEDVAEVVPIACIPTLTAACTNPQQ
jgi:hypothetical protein